MTGTTALLLYLAATFGSMALPYGRKKGSATGSLRTAVSVAGKRIFEGRDKELERASQVQERRCRDRISLNNPAHSGAIRREPGNPLERECVVGLRGLELRAKHAVAIEPISRE
jgi:hypothetical protein